MNEVKFEIEKRTQLGIVTCPKCCHSFPHEKIEHIPVTYEVRAAIRSTKAHLNDKTQVYILSKPYGVVSHEATVVYPKDLDELKTKIKELMVKYKATEGWVFGLGSDKPRSLRRIEDVDKTVDGAVEYMQKFGYTPKFS